MLTSADGICIVFRCHTFACMAQRKLNIKYTHTEWVCASYSSSTEFTFVNMQHNRDCAMCKFVLRQMKVNITVWLCVALMWQRQNSGQRHLQQFECFSIVCQYKFKICSTFYSNLSSKRTRNFIPSNREFHSYLLQSWHGTNLRSNRWDMLLSKTFLSVQNFVVKCLLRRFTRINHYLIRSLWQIKWSSLFTLLFVLSFSLRSLGPCHRRGLMTHWSNSNNIKSFAFFLYLGVTLLLAAVVLMLQGRNWKVEKWKCKQTGPQVIVFNDDDDDCKNREVD